MKIFWMRSVNLLMIATILSVYQSQAYARAQIILAQEEQKKALEARTAYEKAVDEMGDMQMMAKEQSVPRFSDGIYTGTGTGFGGDLTVEVTVENGKISDVSITDTKDDAGYLDKASILLDRIVDAQGTEGVDEVSGATYSSKGILEAVDRALGEE